MRITVRIQKFNPEKDTQPYERDYRLDIAWRGKTVLDTLFQIKDELDGTLTFRYSCRSSICGSCCMVINGQEKLACQTMVVNEIRKHGQVLIRPLKSAPPIKDLAVDMEPFWRKVKQVTPWLEAEGYDEKSPMPVVNQQDMGAFHNVDACIMCGACVSACSSHEVSNGFIGPAALAKAFRFVADPRDQSKQARLESLNGDHGIWDCTRCNFCVEVCPKDVQPMEAIIRLRRAAIRQGVEPTVGSRHITAFTQVVRQEGILNESLLPAKMLLRDPIRLLRSLPLAIKMLFRGKLPNPFKSPIEGIAAVRKIFDARAKGGESLDPPRPKDDPSTMSQ